MNNILVLVEGPTDDTNGSICAAAKKISILSSKAKAKILLEFTLQS